MFLIKRIRYLLLLALVVGAAVFFHSYGRVGVVGQAVAAADELLTGAVRYVALAASAPRRKISEYETDRARLIVELARSRNEEKRLRFLLGVKNSVFANEKRGVVAHVVARDPESWHLTVMTDRGTRDGVRKGYIALTGDGLAGRVISVTGTSSSVLLVTGNGNATSAAAPARGVYGIAYGDGTGLIEMRALPSSVRLRPGDVVTTSGYGGNYPAGLPLGRVLSFKIVHKELSPRVKVKPAADLTNLYYLLLVAP